VSNVSNLLTEIDDGQKQNTGFPRYSTIKFFPSFAAKIGHFIVNGFFHV